MGDSVTPSPLGRWGPEQFVQAQVARNAGTTGVVTAAVVIAAGLVWVGICAIGLVRAQGGVVSGPMDQPPIFWWVAASVGLVVVVAGLVKALRR